MSDNPPSFPMPNPGYQPSYDAANAYAPPSGPPPSYEGSNSYTTPSGPPPTSTDRGYPGQQYHTDYPHHRHHGYPGQSYHAPPGPPLGQGYQPPMGPPPGQGYQSPMPGQGYRPPPGPPPMPPSSMQHYGPTVQTPGQQHQQQPFFQYSQCTGKKKALCIGINYFNSQNELKGCINDARAMQRFLIAQFGYREEDMVVLTDDAKNHRQVPTRENMLQAMQWLVSGAQPNDSLFFHYSGHGGQTKDLDGDEEDGYDEVIYPVDHERAGFIVDDLMHDVLVKPLPPGCRLTAVLDCCHSGSALDLPYMYSHEGKLKEPNLAAEAGQGLLSAVTAYARHDMGGVFSSVMALGKTAMGSNRKAEQFARATKTSPADVISWSGCKDTQTSADTSEGGTATGAMSYAFMTAILRNKHQSYQQLLLSLREILRAEYSQKPQLSSSHPMDTNLMFIC